ncbi:hypothetical protein V8E53_010009 [Lactarius tabidus]
MHHGAQSAHPPDRPHIILPSALFVGQDDKDKYVYDTVRKLSASTGKGGQDLKDAASYTNYAIYGTPLRRCMGRTWNNCL